MVLFFLFCWSSANTEIGLINATTTFATNTNALCIVYTRAKPSTSRNRKMGLPEQEQKKGEKIRTENERMKAQARGNIQRNNKKAIKPRAQNKLFSRRMKLLVGLCGIEFQANIRTQIQSSLKDA